MGKLAGNLLVRIIGALSWVILTCPPSHAQSYSGADSTIIYKWLAKADQHSSIGALVPAMEAAIQSLQLSIKKGMLRGEGYAKLKIADVMLEKDSMAGIEKYYAEGWRIGLQLKDSLMMALSQYQQGKFHMRNEHMEEARKFYDKALALKFEKEQSSYAAFVYNDIGYIYGTRDEFEKEAYWYLKAVRIHEKNGYLDGLATSTHNLATVYSKLGDMPKAFEYTRESIAMREKIGDIKGLAICYESLSRLYWKISLDSASKYQQIAMQYAERTGLKRLMIRSYDNLSVLMDRKRNKPEALRYIQRSIELSKELDDQSGLANKFRWAALLSGDMKDTLAAEEYFKLSFEIAASQNNKTLLRDYYGTRASYHRKSNDFKNAFENLKLYYNYRDSLIKDETATNIAELQTKYETEKKDNEIGRLNTEQRIRQLEIEKQKATIAGNRLEARQKENEIKLLSQQQELRDTRILQQEKELESRTLLAKNNQQALQLAEQEKKLKDKQLESQMQVRNFIIGSVVLLSLIAVILFNRYKLKKRLEQETQLVGVRNNIARDLHDEIGSTLTSIKILSEVSKNNLEKDRQKASTLLHKITEQSSQMQQGMSDIVWAIKPDNDKLQNMLVRMREYASHTLESKNILAIFSVEENVLSHSLDMQQRRDFFLIFKEAINNAAKYSQATKVEIKLAKENGNILLTVTDNGIGFITSKETSSNGLKNMKARTDSLQGQISISSMPGRGTQIIARVPAT
jgi:signal transduction histidine kinase